MKKEAAEATSLFAYLKNSDERILVAIATAAAATVSTAAAAASATTTAAVAAAAAAAAATTAATKSATARFARLGFIDGEGSAFIILAIESGDRGLRLGVAPHFHEAEALAAAGIPVIDDFRALHGAMCREQLLER
jgi:cell wall-associated NlpC family hydrolase